MNKRWIQHWQSVKRLEIDGEIVAEMSLTNGLWYAQSTSGILLFSGNAHEFRQIMNSVESVFA